MKRRIFKSVPSPASVSHRYYYSGWNPVVEKITPSGGATATVRYVPPSQSYGAASCGLHATQVGGAWYFPAYAAQRPRQGPHASAISCGS